MGRLHHRHFVSFSCCQCCVFVVFSWFSSCFFGNFVIIVILSFEFVWPGAMIGEMEMTDGMGDGVGTGVEIGGGALITTGTAGRVLWVLEM